MADVPILIIEDVNSTRFQIRDLLKECGFRKITLVSNGEAAKVCIQVEPPDLILCDWYMTPTDGFEVLKFVRAHPKAKTTPFIMITGEGTKERVIDAIQAGVDDYIVKPLMMTQIQRKVLRVLTRKKVI